MKKLATLALSALLMVLALPAMAQEYPTFDGPLATSNSTTNFEPGETFTVSGDGYEPSATVVVTLESDPVTLATTTADAAGAFETEVTIPADFPAGAHTLKATGAAAGGGTQVLGLQITVAGDLAETGTNIPAGLIVVALIAALAGAVAVRAAKTSK